MPSSLTRRLLDQIHTLLGLQHMPEDLYEPNCTWRSAATYWDIVAHLHSRTFWGSDAQIPF